MQALQKSGGAGRPKPVFAMSNVLFIFPFCFWLGGGRPSNGFWASVGGKKALAYSTAGRIPNRAADKESEKGLYRFSGQMFSKP